MARVALLALSFLLLLFAIALAVTGGFTTTVLGLRVSAHSPGVAVGAALVCLLAWAIIAWRAHALLQDLSAIDRWIATRAHAIVLAMAALAGAVAVRFGTFSAGGADASGYFSEAVMLSARALSRVEPLAALVTWPDAGVTLTPLGWRAVPPDLQVPTYAVGLPMLMAGPHLLWGAMGASLVVSLSFVAAVWWCGRLASALGTPIAGLLAAVWLATAPVALFEAVQPMSDVPVTAAWLACWWWSIKREPDPLFAGLAAAIAILIRPNLAPLALVPALWVAIHSLRAARLFAVPVVLAGAAVGYLQWRWFGSPFRSGYGTAAEIYSLANLAPNSARYLRWLLETQGAWLLAAPIALAWPRRSAGPARWMLAFAALVCLAYFVYAVFEDWSYLRFLLPAVAIAVVAVSVVLGAAIAVAPAAARAPILCALVLGIAGWQISNAIEHGVFRFARRQAGVLQAGRYLESSLPAHAVLVTGEQSGAMRYYTNRSIVRWDLLPASTLGTVAAELSTRGRELWVVLDAWEEEPFRAKFRDTAAAALDWPPAMEAGREMRTRAWRVRDREKFMRGERVPNDRLR